LTTIHHPLASADAGVVSGLRQAMSVQKGKYVEQARASRSRRRRTACRLPTARPRLALSEAFPAGGAILPIDALTPRCSTFTAAGTCLAPPRVSVIRRATSPFGPAPPRSFPTTVVHPTRAEADPIFTRDMVANSVDAYLNGADA
jgi:hypothetical protein